MSYLIYQHLGNLVAGRAAPSTSSTQRVRDGRRRRRRRCASTPSSADREVEGTRWSFCRDIGPARRGDDRLARRARARPRASARWSTPDEWRWIEEHATGDCRPPADRHLAAAAPGARRMHYLEAWNEAVCDGAWGRRAARLGEKLRQALDLEHWAAFGESFERDVRARCARSAPGERGEPPATIVALSGDVHHAYLAEVGFPPGTGVQSRVWQASARRSATRSTTSERRVMRFGASRRRRALIARALARARRRRATAACAGARARRAVVRQPGRDARARRARRARSCSRRALPPDDGQRRPELERVFEHDSADTPTRV